jgi:regulator of replication initiation timing
VTFEARIARLERRLAGAITQLDQTRKELDQTRKELDQTREELAAANPRIAALENEKKKLRAENKRLRAENADLRRRLGLNSTNSSLPPSKDRPKPAPKSLRKKSGRKTGGQPGHKGTTLRKVDNPDEVTALDPVSRCSHCDAPLDDVPVTGVVQHQQVDLTPPERVVRAVDLPTRKCPKCRAKNRPAPPQGFEKPVQYGPTVKAMAVDLVVNQAVSLDRTRAWLDEALGIAVSEGSVAAWIEKASTACEQPLKQIRGRIRGSPVMHADETGLRCESRTAWLHTASAADAVLLSAHRRRGMAAFEEIGVLPGFQGVLVHDALGAYFRLDGASHALCNAHHLRELQGFIDEGAEWAVNVRRQLLRAYRWVTRVRCAGGQIADSNVKLLAGSVRNALQSAVDGLHPRQKTIRRQGNRVKQTHAKNFLDRMLKHFDAVTAFIRDPRIPFTNNQAERDLRMAKVKIKVAGCLRTFQGAQHYARIRSCILTGARHGIGGYAILRGMFNGTPNVFDQATE